MVVVRQGHHHRETVCVRQVPGLLHARDHPRACQVVLFPDPDDLAIPVIAIRLDLSKIVCDPDQDTQRIFRVELVVGVHQGQEQPSGVLAPGAFVLEVPRQVVHQIAAEQAVLQQCSPAMSTLHRRCRQLPVGLHHAHHPAHQGSVLGVRAVEVRQPAHIEVVRHIRGLEARE